MPILADPSTARSQTVRTLGSEVGSRGTREAHRDENCVGVRGSTQSGHRCPRRCLALDAPGADRRITGEARASAVAHSARALLGRVDASICRFAARRWIRRGLPRRGDVHRRIPCACRAVLSDPGDCDRTEQLPRARTRCEAGCGHGAIRPVPVSSLGVRGLGGHAQGVAPRRLLSTPADATRVPDGG